MMGLVLDKDVVQKQVDEFMATERILNRQRRNRTIGHRLAWATFWIVVASVVGILTWALGDTLAIILEVLESLGT